MATGLAIAMLLNMKVKGMNWYRTAFYIPSIVPAIAWAVLWAWILAGDPNKGLLNALWNSTLTPLVWLGAAGLVWRGGMGQAGPDRSGFVGRGRRHDFVARRFAGHSRLAL